MQLNFTVVNATTAIMHENHGNGTVISYIFVKTSTTQASILEKVKARLPPKVSDYLPDVSYPRMDSYYADYLAWYLTTASIHGLVVVVTLVVCLRRRKRKSMVTVNFTAAKQGDVPLTP